MFMLYYLLYTFLPSLIHLDQVSFILNQEALMPPVGSLTPLKHAELSWMPSLLISLDVEKAFDRLLCSPQKIWSWRLAGLQALSSTDSILWRVHPRGVLSIPLVFAMLMEPLATHIRCSSDISCINFFDFERKINLFAVDVILRLSNPTVPFYTSSTKDSGKLYLTSLFQLIYVTKSIPPMTSPCPRIKYST